METISQTTAAQNTDLFEQQPKGLPGTLNVLTILMQRKSNPSEILISSLRLIASFYEANLQV